MQIEEIVQQIEEMTEKVTDLVYQQVREQTNGVAGAKERERRLAAARRALVKAEHELRLLL